MLTKRSQTENNFQIKHEETQVYCKKEIATQTAVSNYTNTPKLMRYIYGLRGMKENKQAVFNMKVFELEPQYTNKFSL